VLSRLTAIPPALRDRWDRVGTIARRRMAAGLGALALLALLALVVLPNVACEFPGGDRCPLPDDAEELVPGDAIAYVHVELDPNSPQRQAASDVASQLPLFSSQLGGRALALIPGPEGRAPDLERDLEPWFTGEAALAVLPAGASSQQVELLEIADAEGAERFQQDVAAGTASASEHEGVEISVDRRGLATAQVEGFLVIGRSEGVRAVIDTATGAGDTGALADEQEATELRDELPDERVVDAYLTAEGVESYFGAPGAPLGTFAPFLAPGPSEGAAIALSAADGALELAVRSRLDPERAEAEPPFFAAFPAFEPELTSRLGADSLGYVGIGDPGSTVQALIGQASVEAPGIAAGFEDLLNQLRRRGEVDLDADLLSALGAEAAFALAPREGGAEGPGGTPFLEFVASDVDEERVRRALADLQAPLAKSVDPGLGLQAPVFGEREVAGIPTRSLRISPAVELAYAVFDGLAVIATDPVAIERLAEGEGGLDESERFTAATEGFGESASLLAFFDLGELVSLAEAAGLATDPEYITFADEFRRLQAVGLSVADDEGLLTTNARLLISG
jgi:hypothetical protein